VSVKKGDARSGGEQTERNKKEEEKIKNDGIKLRNGRMESKLAQSFQFCGFV